MQPEWVLELSAELPVWQQQGLQARLLASLEWMQVAMEQLYRKESSRPLVRSRMELLLRRQELELNPPSASAHPPSAGKRAIWFRPA
jgi:hypothetical protein